MKTIVLIEDNEDIIKGLDYLFMQNDMLMFSAKTIEEAKKILTVKEYDLILLDVTLPDEDVAKMKTVGDVVTYIKKIKK